MWVLWMEYRGDNYSPTDVYMMTTNTAINRRLPITRNTILSTFFSTRLSSAASAISSGSTQPPVYSKKMIINNYFMKKSNYLSIC